MIGAGLYFAFAHQSQSPTYSWPAETGSVNFWAIFCVALVVLFFHRMHGTILHSPEVKLKTLDATYPCRWYWEQALYWCLFVYQLGVFAGYSI